MKGLYPTLFFLFLVTRLASQSCSLNCNVGFDSQYITASVGLTTSINCWSTTASDGNMEVWANGFNGVPAYNGTQFVELNATQAATMWQNVSVTNGSPISISFAHRGRAGTDTIQVSIGPVGGPYTVLGRWGDGTSAWGYYTVPYTPTSTAVYQVNFTPVYWSGGNVAIGNFLDAVNVTAPISLTIAAGSYSICPGSSTTLTANGASTYTWSGGPSTATYVVSPNVTTTYTVAATATTGCTGTKVVTVTVLSSSISVNSTSLCAGNSATLIASGVGNYTWSTGATTSSIVVTPIINTSYTVTGSNGVCSASAVANVTVDTPTIAITGATSICSGFSVALAASGVQNYTWNPGNVTTYSIGSTPSVTTVYTVTGKDALGCSTVKLYTLIVAPTPTVTVPGYSVCLGGTVYLTASGASTYTWSNGAVGNPIPVMPTTNTVYTAIGTATNGCVSTGSTTVYISSAPTLSFTTNAISCASLGSATVQCVSGVGPFTFTWYPTVQTGSVANNLNPNTYTVTVFDAGMGCLASSTTTFASPTPYTASLSSTGSLTCYGASTGTAAFSNVAGGSGNQNYLWTNGSSSYSTPTVNTLSAGTWTATVTDALTGCQVFSVFTITQPPTPTLNITASSPTSCAGTSIALTGSNSGGTPGYTYTWTAGPASPNYTISQPLAGTYVYTLNSLDSKNCLTSKTISVNFVPNPTITVASVSVCPQQTGTLVASGASTYTWSNGSTGNPFTDAPAATTLYTVTGAAQGCTATATASIVLKPLPVPTISSNSPLCTGYNLQLNAGGGLAYTWNGPATFTSNLQNPSINPADSSNTGIYTVVVTGANSCTAAASTSVTIYPPPALQAIGSSLCAGQTMSLWASSAPGSTYKWMGPLGFNSTQQNVFIPNAFTVQSGSYTVTVTSAAGCTNLAVALVSIVPQPTLGMALSSNSFCAQALNGSPNTITLTSSGATTYTLLTPSHILNPNPAGPASPLSMLPPYAQTGLTTATLIGSNGVCAVTATTLFIIIPNPTVTISNTAPVICAGQSFTYTSSGATTYTWFGTNLANTTGSAAVASPSVNSIFSVIGNSLGCNSATQSSSLAVNPLPQLNVSPMPYMICYGSSTPITAGGNGTLYNWQPPSFLSSTTGATVTASPPASQVYVVTSSLNNCTISAMITVSVLPIPTVTITTPKNGLCLNSSLSMQGSATPAGGSYNWSGPAGYSALGPDVNLNAFSPSCSGLYTLAVSDAKNCTGIATKSITVYDLPHGYFLADKNEGCVPFCTNFHFTANPQATPIQLWQANVLGFTSVDSVFNYCFNTPGTYTVSTYMKDAMGCENTVNTVVTAHNRPVADFDYTPKVPVEELDEVTFNNESSADAVKFEWSFDSEPYNIIKTSSFTKTFLNAGNYVTVLVAENSYGCRDTAIKVLWVDPDFSIYIPNAFTPNGDGRNDLFGPVARGITEIKLEVFDRWGEEIFSTTSLTQGWDGTYKGQLCKDDIYAWKLYVKARTSAGDKEKSMTGSVMLLK